MKQHQVILHIGQTKTGTTSIQDFLHTNQVNLEASDIYYTQRPARYTSHRYLFHLINSSIPEIQGTPFRDKHVSILKQQFDGIYGENIDAYWKYFKCNLFKNSCDVSIISEELLWELGKFEHSLKEDMIQMFASHLQEVVSPENIQIFVALRHHAEWLESWHNQMVKDQFNQMKILPFFKREINYQSFDYLNNLLVWKKYFPRARFKVIDFKKSLVSNRPIGIIFLEQLGLLNKLSKQSFQAMIYPDRLQEAIHPMVHAYMIRYKPKIVNQIQYKQSIKLASYMVQGILNMHGLNKPFTILSPKVIERCNQLSSSDSLTQFGLTSLVNSLHKKRQIPLLFPEEITDYLNRIFNH